MLKFDKMSSLSSDYGTARTHGIDPHSLGFLNDKGRQVDKFIIFETT